MVRERDMVGETDKTDRGGGGGGCGEEEVTGAAEEQLKSWESLAVICASAPVSG